MDGTDGNAVLSKVGGAAGNNGYQMGIFAQSGQNKIWCAFNAPGEPWPTNIITGGNVPLNQWSFISCVYDGTDLIGYINAQEVGRLNAPGKSVANTTATLRISGDDNNHVYFNGIIDEATIYDRALTIEEIAQEYNAAMAGKCISCASPPSDIISWWRAEDNAMDCIGEHDGTLMNGAGF